MAKPNGRALVPAPKSLRDRLPSIGQVLARLGHNLETVSSVQTERDAAPWQAKLQGLRVGDDAQSLIDLLETQVESVRFTEKVAKDSGAGKITAPGFQAGLKGRASIDAQTMADTVRAWALADADIGEALIEAVEGTPAPALPAPAGNGAAVAP